MVWNGEVEKKELQPDCKCCCACRGVISPHGYWTEYTMRTSPYDLNNPNARTWGSWFSLTRVPEIVGGSKLCKLCLWISSDKHWVVGNLGIGGSGIFGINTERQNSYNDWQFQPTPQNTHDTFGVVNGPDVRCEYYPVANGYIAGQGTNIIIGESRFLFPYTQGVGTTPATGEIKILGTVGNNQLAGQYVVEVQAGGQFVCCSTCCATAPAGDMELTITGCGGSPSQIVVTLPKVAANTSITGHEFLRKSVHWETPDLTFLFGCNGIDGSYSIPAASNRRGYVLSYPSSNGLRLNSWLQCEPGSDFVAFFSNVEYVCPDNVHRIVTMEIRQAGGGVMPGYGYGDCFPYGNSPPPPPPPPAVP